MDQRTHRQQTRSLGMALACAGISFLAAACASSDTGAAVRGLPPAPLLVLVERAESATPTKGATLSFSATEAQIQTMLAEELRALDASSRVVTPTELGQGKADVVVRFMPNGPIEFAHQGTSSFLGAGGLWLVTWIGGLLVPDSRYSVKVGTAARCRVQFGDAYFERSIDSGEVDLSFFDRNSLASWQGLQSLVLPPFWTSDQSEKTSEALTRATMRLAARRIAVLLKSEFEDAAASDFGCKVKVDVPKNGEPATATRMPITFTAYSRSDSQVQSATAVVNDLAPQKLVLGDRVGEDGVIVSGMLEGLDPTRENWVRLRITADRTYTRTLRLGPSRSAGS